MSAVASVELPVLDEWGHARCRIRIAVLPINRLNRNMPLIVDARNEPLDQDDDLENVRLVEGTEYLYELDVPGTFGPIDTDHPEMFVADTERGDRGRLRTGLYTGAVEVKLFAAKEPIGKVCFEVQSTKLDYMADYRWMLRDIAEVCTDLVMDRFAPSAARFSVDESRDSETLYQQFSFLRSLLQSEEFHAAIGRILAAPHVTWEEVEEASWQAHGLRPSSRIARSLVRPGPRTLRDDFLVGEIDSIPQPMVVSRMGTTVDNLPNRFVKWVLREWIGMINRVSTALDRNDEKSIFVRRGKREIASLMKELEAILDDDLFRDVGDLTVFPGGSQVLQKRDGYRTILSAQVQFEAAARLHWPGMEDLYRAGQRNVAKLYEYWVYLQLGHIIARFCGRSFDAARLVQSSADGLTLRLRSPEEALVEGTLERLGQSIRLEFWFNKSFGATGTGFGAKGAEGDPKPQMFKLDVEGSWTRPLRPDCSLFVEVGANTSSTRSTWIHFDAKYRIESVEESFAKEDDDDTIRANWRREDLLKMHAYKDAIRRSAGAYIIYPGRDAGKPFRQYHELLPGLGAFALRPSKGGESIGAEALANFMEHVLTHLALRASQHERARYWAEQAYAGHPVWARVPAASFVSEPPADVLVLLGYAKNGAHRAFIKQQLMYNLRADAFRGGAVGINSREIAAQLLVVYGEDKVDVDIYRIVEAPRIMTARQLESIAYPQPRGNHYLCLPLEAIEDARVSKWLTSALVERVRARTNTMALVGAPVVVTWLDLCAEANVEH